MSTLVLVICLAASVAGSALVRMERSTGSGCGAPNYNIPHGGIKLFPITDFSDSHDYSCQVSPDPFFCEYKFYCDDGYVVQGDFHLECVAGGRWEGNVPTCVEAGSSYTTYYVVPGVIFPICFFIGVVIAASRRRRRLAANGNRSSTVRVIQTTSVPRPGRSLTTGGPPGYKRFDDSNVQVPRDVTPSTNGATNPCVLPPPYMCPGGPGAAPASNA